MLFVISCIVGFFVAFVIAWCLVFFSIVKVRIMYYDGWVIGLCFLGVLIVSIGAGYGAGYGFYKFCSKKIE